MKVRAALILALVLAVLLVAPLAAEAQQAGSYKGLASTLPSIEERLAGRPLSSS